MAAVVDTRADQGDFKYLKAYCVPLNHKSIAIRGPIGTCQLSTKYPLTSVNSASCVTVKDYTKKYVTKCL